MGRKNCVCVCVGENKRQEAIVQQDNTPVHITKTRKSWFKHWPLWCFGLVCCQILAPQMYIKAKLVKRKFRNTDQLWEAVRNKCNYMLLHTVNNLTVWLSSVLSPVNCISAEGVTATPSYEYPWYDTKPSDGEAPVLELWGMWNTSSFSLFPGSLWSGVVVPFRVVFMGQIEPLVLYRDTWTHLTLCKP